MKLSRKINDLINWYFSKRTLPYWCIILLDCAIIFFSALLTYWMSKDGSHVLGNILPIIRTMILYIGICIIFFAVNHTYSGIIRYSSFVDLQRVGLAMLSAGAVILLVNIPISRIPEKFFVHFTAGEIIVIIGISILLMWAMRILVKMVYDIAFRAENAENVLVYGIMDGGVGLAKNIRNEKPARFNLKGFISHDPKLTYTRLLGEKVYSVDESLPEVIQRLGIKAVLVSPKRNDVFREDQQLQDYIINAGAKIYMVHQAEEWRPGQDAAAGLKQVSIEDLLPREQITVDLQSVEESLHGKKVLITGSAGSIGSEIVRQVCQFAPAELVLIDQAETPQHDLRLLLAKEFPGIQAQVIVSSITNRERMEKIFSDFRPEFVFHAAAYKHVPMMEDNPGESVWNNILGTRIIADLAVKYGVQKFVMISTDKAVNPTNVMGCSKRICEIYVQSLNKAETEGKVEGHTQFVTTRFGNVLGSNGSVIPLFEAQIHAGGPVTVTHPDIIRYFMLIPEACKLVLEAGTKGNGGEIFVFDMGKPVKIADLAKRMIKLSGAKDIEIRYTGLRDGEKLYEEVLNEKETTKPSFHEKIRIASVREYDYDAVCREIDALEEITRGYDPMAIVAQMKRIVPEYKSNNSVYSVLDN